MSGTLDLAAATVDQAVQFGGVATAKILYIEADGELTFKFNGGSDVLKLGAPVSGQKAKVMWEGEFSEMSVSNAGTAAVQMTYYVAG
jgi:hypothetical protein